MQALRIPLHTFPCTRGTVVRWASQHGRRQGSLDALSGARLPKQRPIISQNRAHNSRTPPRYNWRSTLCLAALTPLTMVEIGETQTDDGKTGEEHMLEASRAELAQQVPRLVQGSNGIRRGIWKILDTYILEPIATGLRLLHLIVLFVPVIITVPAIWIGRTHPERDNERTGTLWWYGFLTSSMERAGAAFIKVSLDPPRLCGVLTLSARAMGSIEVGHLP